MAPLEPPFRLSFRASTGPFPEFFHRNSGKQFLNGTCPGILLVSLNSGKILRFPAADPAVDGRLWVTCAVSPEGDSEDDTTLDEDDGRLLVFFSSFVINELLLFEIGNCRKTVFAWIFFAGFCCCSTCANFNLALLVSICVE
jgi:hypothetical protein